MLHLVIFLEGDLSVTHFYTVDVEYLGYLLLERPHGRSRETPWRMFQCSVLRTYERYPHCLGREQRLNQAGLLADLPFDFVGADSLVLVAVDLLARRR